MRPSVFAILACAVATPALAAKPVDLQKQFHDTVQPFAAKYCAGCHSGATPAAQFDIKSYDSLAKVKAEFPRWALVSERLHAKEMPPKPMKAPPQDEMDKIISFVEAVRAEEIKRAAGDPGIVLARRLSNVEYGYTIRDLTGQDLKIARQFPVDPANPAGFDNSGESLTMSPALLNKYLQAARQIADHLVLKPDGFDFASHLVQVDSDRDKYTIGRIMAFYKAQPTDTAKYFEAAWRYRHRAALGNAEATLASIAASMKISAKYLPLVWGILNEKDAVGPVATLQKMWLAMPAPSAKNPAAGLAPQVQAKAIQMRDFTVRIRKQTAMQFTSLKIEGLPGQTQPLQNSRLKTYAANHRKSDPVALRADSEPPAALPQIPKYPGLHMDATPRWNAVMAHARAVDSDLVYPAGQKAQYQKAFERFASVFPDTFVVTERGRYWPDESEDKGRFLSAGYHNSGGYYRDDTALMQLILDEKGQRQINRLWDEFDYIADHTQRTYTQWFFNNAGVVDGLGAESGLPRPAGHEVTESFVINQMRDKYVAKALADKTNDPGAADAMRSEFARVNGMLRYLEQERKAAEPKHLAALVNFAERAYRRPLVQAERDSLLAYYKTVRARNRLSHNDAVRDSIVSVLMSPDFLYRFDLSRSASAQAQSPLVNVVTAAPAKPFVSERLSSYSLANRLSYFIWSSMPDAELLRHAASGDLQNPKVLAAQARRMLKDPKAKGLATEFTGNWLVFRQFETNNSVDRQRFPTFNDDLREAMFQEPIRLVQDNMANDRSVLDLLYGKYTFVNPPLARHYGMPDVPGDVNNWVRVNDADKYGRGGILPMAVFMTQNSPGLRTSPVKRGNWVVQKVLGIRVPPPPPVVPELPNDEAKADRPIREMLAQHRAVPMCAACHSKFDSFGLVFEGFGPVGDARAKDGAGRPVDTSASFPGGVEGVGVAGLQAFIRDHRQNRFVDNLSRKLLAFALNRSLQLSDESLVDKMNLHLAANGYRFSALVETVVLSPQFLNRRLPERAELQKAQLQPIVKLVKTAFQKGN
jgi:mono/diheme cytochrome c family protein